MRVASLEVRNQAKPTGFSRPRRMRGNTLLELMVSVCILTLVAGVVFSQISDLLKKNTSEQGKVDITQQTREFMDEIIRDMHQAGYPSLDMYDPNDTTNYPSCVSGTYCSSSRVAMGVTSFSPTDLKMEGDFDGDGTVNVVEYQLYDNSGTAKTSGNVTCPCSLRRIEYQKANGVGTSSFYVEVQNLINGDASGTVTINGSTLQGVSNTSVFSGYTSTSIFQAFDASGNAVTGTYPITTTTTLRTIHTIRVTMNVLSQYQDPNTKSNNVVSMTAAARVHNDFLF
jgi:Tfp pilus assembly protein PilW